MLAKRLTELCSRIDELDPSIKALLPEENRLARLLAEAERLEREWPDPAGRPALWGMEVAVKDVIHVDGLPTRAGSRLPPEVLAGPQGPAVTGLIRAGALILGKAHTTEFAYLTPGPTRNPLNLEHTPGGSSSGSAAAVAAGFARLALGTQIVGSVIRPAAYCGVLGFKPSLGRIPLGGVLPFSPSEDQIGLLAGGPEHLEQAAAVLCSGWNLSGSAEPSRRLGLLDGPLMTWVEPRALRVFTQDLSRLAKAGYHIERLTGLEDLERIRASHADLMAAEAAEAHAVWYGRFAALYGREMVEVIERSLKVPRARLPECRQSMTELRARLTGIMDRSGLEAFICPSATGVAPKGLATTGNAVMCLPWTHAGLPCLSLPSGGLDGLPLGLQVVGRFGEDEALLRLSKDLAKALPKAPRGFYRDGGAC